MPRASAAAEAAEKDAAVGGDQNEGADSLALTKAERLALKNKPTKTKEGIAFQGLILKPWDGKKESLPAGSWSSEKTRQRSGQAVVIPPRFLKAGEARHFLQRAGAGKFKILAAFRSKGGVSTRLLALLKDTAKRPADREAIRSLQKAGLPLL